MKKQPAFHIKASAPMLQLIEYAALALAVWTSFALAEDQAAIITPDEPIPPVSENAANLETHGDRFKKTIARIHKLREQPEWSWDDGQDCAPAPLIGEGP
ncbi:hypothetical protein [Aurantimonas coralicida]|uniref:hypothetical protein n=1 Tax=Aurantimonas coralicida TaxID=182270 RepID=UPI001E42DFFF|nr:hypothetical protein [Aurantimonas coralicida]MCD1644503.1 hypothetical protein [Aurantimonas coralicida]|tara:strand:- start:428 stop:727 length:300 start_codon:yes stop_codon:yes gene_type:complete